MKFDIIFRINSIDITFLFMTDLSCDGFVFCICDYQTY